MDLVVQILQIIIDVVGIGINAAALAKAVKVNHPVTDKKCTSTACLQDEANGFLQYIKALATLGLIVSLLSTVVLAANLSPAFYSSVFIYAYSYFLHFLFSLLSTLFLLVVVLAGVDRVTPATKIKLPIALGIAIPVLMLANIHNFFMFRPACWNPSENQFRDGWSMNGTSNGDSDSSQDTHDCYLEPMSHPFVIGLLDLIYKLVFILIPLIVLLVVINWKRGSDVSTAIPF
jgi:hypothetical protein